MERHREIILYGLLKELKTELKSMDIKYFITKVFYKKKSEAQ